MHPVERPDRAGFVPGPAATVGAGAPSPAGSAPRGPRRRAARGWVALGGRGAGRPRGALRGRSGPCWRLARRLVRRWSLGQLLDCIGLFFRLGIRHLLVGTLGPRQMAEVGNRRILAWTVEATAGPRMLAAYQERGWRARILAPTPLPGLQEAAARLAA